MSRLQEAKDLLAAGCGLDYLQNLEYHGVLGTVPGCKGPNHGWAMPPGISIKDAVWGTINVEQAKWKPALTEFATLRELLDAMVAEVERLEMRSIPRNCECGVEEQCAMGIEIARLERRLRDAEKTIAYIATGEDGFYDVAVDYCEKYDILADGSGDGLICHEHDEQT